jgi:hypothetical protein
VNTSRMISSLAIAGAVVIGGAASASAAGTDSREAVSANWSGYTASATSGGAGKRFSSVSGSWIQPSVDCTSGAGYASFWVGLGGARQQSQGLEQVGTEADCRSDGTASQFAWYELVPAVPVKLDLAIHPGDHVSANVAVSGSSVTVALADRTTGASATKTLQMDNPETWSAEWIAEAPSSCDGSGDCQPLPLANFGSVSFTDASATANGHTGTISDPNWNARPLRLSGTDQASGGAAPSPLSTDGASFSVAWQSSAAQSSTSAGTGIGQSPTRDAAGGGGYSTDGGGPGGPRGYGGYGG